METTHEGRFHENVTDLIRLCRDIITDAQHKGFKSINVGLIDIASIAIEKCDPAENINVFIQNSHKFWDQMHAKEEDFFHENMAAVFADIPLIDMPAITGLLRAIDPATKTLLVPEEDREAIWDFLFSMVKICIKYIHQRRQPCIYPVDGGQYKRFYRTSFLPDVKLERHAKKWGILLEFPKVASK